MCQIKTVVLKLYPNKEQERAFLDTLERCRCVYNHFLEMSKTAHKNGEKVPSKFDFCYYLVGFRKEHAELKKDNVDVLRNVGARVSLAFQNYFRRLKEHKNNAGYPRFKTPSRYDSFSFAHGDFRIVNNRLKLSKIGKILASGFRKMNGQMKTCTIKREGNSPHYRWKACITYSFDEISSLYIEPRSVVGIDLGLIDVMTTSDGKKYQNPHTYKKTEKSIAKLRRKMSSLDEKDERYVKIKQKLYHAFKHISNSRKAELYRIIHELTNKYELIALENINIAKLQEKSLNKEMTKSYRDACWNTLIHTLCIKAEEAGCTIVKVNPAYTSQQCSNCGLIIHKSLSERRHVCKCGLDIDRDVNAALNILRLGLQALRSSDPKGRDSKESITALKQKVSSMPNGVN